MALHPLPHNTDDRTKGMMNPELLKQVCRIIAEDAKVYTDETWEIAWRWYTDPHNTEKGGPWSTSEAAKKIVTLVLSSIPPLYIFDPATGAASIVQPEKWDEDVVGVLQAVMGDVDAGEGGLSIPVEAAVKKFLAIYEARKLQHGQVREAQDG